MKHIQKVVNDALIALRRRIASIQRKTHAERVKQPMVANCDVYRATESCALIHNA